MAIRQTTRPAGRSRLRAGAVVAGVAVAGVAFAGPAVTVAAAAPAAFAPSPTVTSAVFPASPATGPVVRTPGTFTFSVAEPNTVVEFDYVLNGTLSTPGTNPHVAPGSDGTATTPVIQPTQWGTNTLTVEAIDAAGDVSQPTTYQFFMTALASQDKHGDFNGDGTVDLLSVGSDGTLGFSDGLGNGKLAATVPAAPGVDYTGALIAGGGQATRGFFQDLALFQNGNLYENLNNGLGVFSPTQRVLVSPPSGLTAWPALTQLVSPGDITGHNRMDLIGKVGDQLLLFPGVGLYRYGAPVAIAGSGWTGQTVVGVVDVTGDGVPDLVSRDDATGDIWLYQGVKGGTFGDQTTRVLIGSGLKAEKFPLVIAKGDANGDGLADIWAVRKNGDLFLLAGKAGGGFAKPEKVSKHHTWLGTTTLG